MSPGCKLKAIKRLRLTDGLGWEDAHDIAQWVAMAGAQFEMGQFSEKTLERIDSIYQQYFED